MLLGGVCGSAPAHTARALPVDVSLTQKALRALPLWHKRHPVPQLLAVRTGAGGGGGGFMGCKFGLGNLAF